MKSLICPQCGGILHLTQYAGVYHCRYCRTLVESDVQALRELEIRERELALAEQLLADTRADVQKCTEKLWKWQRIYLIWRISMIATLVFGIVAAYFPSSASQPLVMLFHHLVIIRIFGAPIVTGLRPDDAYPPDEPPHCRKLILLLVFWTADMLSKVFFEIALTS